LDDCITNPEEPTNNKINQEDNINYTENNVQNNSITPKLKVESGELEINTKTSFEINMLCCLNQHTLNQKYIDTSQQISIL